MRDDSDGDDFTQSSCLHPAGVYCTTARQEKRWYRENALGSISGDFLVSIHLIINTSGLEHVCKEPFCTITSFNVSRCIREDCWPTLDQIIHILLPSRDRVLRNPQRETSSIKLRKMRREKNANMLLLICLFIGFVAQ